MATQFLSHLKRFQFDNKAAFHTQKTKQSYNYFSDSSSCFNWDVWAVEAWAGEVSSGTVLLRCRLLDIYIQKKAAVLSPPAMTLNQKKQRAEISTGGAAILFEAPGHGRWASRQHSSARGTVAAQPGHQLLSLLYFLTHFFYRLFWFFCPFIALRKGSVAFKTAKNDNHKENSLFSRSTVPNSEQTQKPRGTRNVSKYSMDWLGCANKLHIGNSQ